MATRPLCKVYQFPRARMNRSMVKPMVKPWSIWTAIGLTWLTRAGLLGKAIAYLLTSLVGLRIVFRLSDVPSSPMHESLPGWSGEQALASCVWAMIVIGLAVFAVSRLVRAYSDTQQQTHAGPPIMSRLRLVASALVQVLLCGGLAFWALSPAASDAWSAGLLPLVQHPLGSWSLVLAAITLGSYGFSNLRQALKQKSSPCMPPGRQLHLLR